ncbi:L-aspartate oxidase [[Phormidium] sp. LEGE 05292]|uniref:L-aspartate oxidase n=1 Tax=[Phormidium] sp. LEGE 05292 TaxID=767427 RepID=UPI002AD36C71|nr:L-aspartate oxidase [Phormidium sp. LEGE 05292]
MFLHSSISTTLANRFDVLVVGAGAAGLYTALCLPESLQVGLITKDSLPLSASDWAQGGIAAVIDPSDSPQLHIEDTMQAGAGLCELAAVKFLVEQAPSCIDSLVQMGVGFDRKGDRLALTLEAAHSRPRVLHAADTTGRAVVSTLTTQVLERPNIQVLSPAFVLDLWLSENGHCQGVSLIYQGELLWVSAQAVVLATGGGGQVFSQTTNPAVSTGDGVALAYRAGAIVRDLEFCQFHPTALMKPDAPHFLISEAVRGEGAHLIDSQGYRFAFDYHPKGELAPRDVVSRAIFHHLQHTGEPHGWLDLRPIPPEQIRHRFPNIIQVCQHWGIDVFSEPIPVSPAAHYWMGGILVDLMNQTSIPGLYAVGETASTGVHGANRLASNSLLECIVFGAQMSNLQIESAAGNKGTRGQGEAESSSFSSAPLPLEPLAFLPSLVKIIREELPQLMWRCAGISRRGDELESAIAQVELWQKEFATLEFSQFFQNLQPSQSVLLNIPDIEAQIKLWGETRNLLDVAYLILKSAVFRTESRGGHYRADFPETSPEWQVHTLVKNNQWWQSSLVGNGDWESC